MTRRSQPPYPPELRERAVRMVAEVADDYDSPWAAMNAVAEKLGVGTGETVRKWVRQAEVDGGVRPGTTTEESEELRRLRRENAELKRANEILKAASLDSTGQRNTPQVVDHDRGGRWHAWAGRGCPM
ncbi:transposase, partial [Pseudonocardia alni]|uniref:transposase n=1 Tax=Pseudonocardia alni TaxID=33907 RepID=UPI0036891B1F